MKKTPLAILATIALVIIAVFSLLCGNYNEGSMDGSCVVPALTPIFNGAMNIVLLLAFSAIFWVPVLVLFIYVFTSAQRDAQSAKSKTTNK